MLLICILTVRELFYSNVKIISLIERNDAHSRIEVRLNMTVHSIPCSALNLDLQDMTGLYLEDVRYTLKKSSKYQKHTQTYLQIDNCYGAQLIEEQQCLTCQDVMLAFAARGWEIPSRESIAQCMPDGITTMQFNDYQREYYLQMADETQRQIREFQQHLNATEYQDEQEEIVEKQDDPLLKEILTKDQKDHFKSALSELTEIGYNPMQWDQDRLKEEQFKRVDSLISMLNISLDSIGKKHQSQLKFADRERVISYKNLSTQNEQLTEIYRQQCVDHIRVTVEIKYGEFAQQNIIELLPEQCSAIFTYNSTQNQSSIEINIQYQNHFSSLIILRNHTLLNIIQFEIIEILVVNDALNYTYAPTSMLDKAYSSFRFNIYVPIQSNRTRNLYTDVFSVVNKHQQPILPEQIQDIEDHLHESCHIYGFFHIRKVPGIFEVGFSGKGQAAKFLNYNFTINHTIHTLAFVDKQMLPQTLQPLNDFSSQNQIKETQNYFLKIVSAQYFNSWNNSQLFYTFTALKQSTPLKPNNTLPKITFQYDFDPISMKYIEEPFTSNIISLLSIIGGVFAFSSYLAKLSQII